MNERIILCTPKNQSLAKRMQKFRPINFVILIDYYVSTTSTSYAILFAHIRESVYLNKEKCKKEKGKWFLNVCFYF